MPGRFSDMNRIYYSLILILLTLTASFGQAVRISDKPDQFVADVQKLMATGGPAGVRAGTNLQAIWSENRLSAQQQERVMALSRKMNQTRLPAATIFTPFYESLYLATQQQPATNVDGLITISEKLFETTDAKVFARSLETVRRFMDRRGFYASKYNKLYAQGGTFEFRFFEGLKSL